MNSSHCEFCGEKKCREFQQGAFKNKLTIVSYKAHSQAAAECIPRAVGEKNTDSTVGIFFFNTSLLLWPLIVNSLVAKIGPELQIDKM